MLLLYHWRNYIYIYEMSSKQNGHFATLRFAFPLFRQMLQDTEKSNLKMQTLSVLQTNEAKLHPHFHLWAFVSNLSNYIYIYIRPPFRMEYRHLHEMGAPNICFIAYQSCKTQWNTLPELWNSLISIFHSSMEFHGTHQKFQGIPWNFSRS